VGQLVLGMVPAIVGAALVPVWAIITLLLLQGKGGLLKAAAFAAGAITLRLAQGVVFGYVLGTAASSDLGGGTGKVVPTLFLVLGVLMFVTAFRQWRKDDDPDGPPPNWMSKLSGLTAPKAFGAGALLVAIAAKQWVFTFAVLGMIGDAGLPQVTGATAFLIYVLAAQSFALIPIIVYAVAPKQSEAVLKASREWLQRHNRVIMIVISLVFGVLFLVKGATGILG
jgi:hypothetical protein